MLGRRGVVSSHNDLILDSPRLVSSSTMISAYQCLNSLNTSGFAGSSPSHPMFNHLVTTRLARDILERFLIDGTVTCTEERSRAEELRYALESAYAEAVAHECIRPDAPPPIEPREPETKYRWGWREFPIIPIDENKLVTFLNTVADRALSTAKSILGDKSLKPRNRFAALVDKSRGILLSYGLYGEVLCPDFIVLPLAAFSDDEEPKVNEAYINFTAVLLAGELKSAPDTTEGLMRVRRYITGIKRAQPWLRFATGMTVGEDFITLLREDYSGTERIDLSLTDRQGCIELIRIILGIVLSEKEEFGHDPNVETGEEDVRVDVPELCSAAFDDSSKDGTVSTKSNDVPDDETYQGSMSKRTTRRATLRTRVPIRVHGRECMGILSGSGSNRDTGTTVYVVASDGGKACLALKRSWQDAARTYEKVAVLKKLCDSKAHPGVVTPSSFWLEPKGKGGESESIEAFLAEDIQQLKVENHILMVITSELRRPVAYFWSPHDFVRGLLGALLGHQHLCKIGIHGDINENSIVLSLRRGGLGALIDFDTAVIGCPDVLDDQEKLNSESVSSATRLSSPVDGDPYREITDKTPFKSIGVLRGQPHTCFDDIESFLYVLVQFFFSYAGPLQEEVLRRAQGQRFVQPVGEAQLPHMTSLPTVFQRWASSSFKEIPREKLSDVITASRDAFFQDAYLPLYTRWAPASGGSAMPRAILKLITATWILFPENDCKVKHEQFANVLKGWLEDYAGDEDKYPYPFDD
ncbi:hypothetical protein EDD15DRAFT_1116590 [Pisolithus albus]|nr:hypothetical protein EDD15DRAFT_1116590 [Pisolithus albus]